MTLTLSSGHVYAYRRAEDEWRPPYGLRCVCGANAWGQRWRVQAVKLDRGRFG